MEKNNTPTPSFSICKKIRQALASNLAFRAVHRIKQYYQEPKPVVTTHSNSPLPPTPTTHPPQHIKVSTKAKGEGAIPIKFDYSTTPTSTRNGNSEISMVHSQASKVASPHVGVSERTGKVAAKVEQSQSHLHVPRQGKHQKKVVEVKGEYNGKHKAENTGPLKEQHGVVGMMNLEQQGKKSPLDINDTFTEYIQRAKYRIRTMSNVGRGKSNSAPDEANGCGTNKIEIQKDHFSDFIQQAKKKIRTTSSIGRSTGSLKIVNSGPGSLTKNVDH